MNFGEVFIELVNIGSFVLIKCIDRCVVVCFVNNVSYVEFWVSGKCVLKRVVCW